MRTDGSEERLLTASFLDEGPTWAPNGRVLMFTRETAGAAGAPAALLGRHLGTEPQAGADAGAGLGRGMVAASALKPHVFKGGDRCYGRGQGTQTTIEQD